MQQGIQTERTRFESHISYEDFLIIQEIVKVLMSVDLGECVWFERVEVGAGCEEDGGDRKSSQGHPGGSEGGSGDGVILQERVIVWGALSSFSLFFELVLGINWLNSVDT